MTNFNEVSEKTDKEGKAPRKKTGKADQSPDHIKTGNIDALVVADEKKLKVYTENQSDKVYRLLIEKMHEGAVTLNEEGTILYCNSYFADMINHPLQKITGTKFNNFIDDDDASQERFKTLCKEGWVGYAQDEANINTSNGESIPVQVSVNALSLDNYMVLSVVITNLTSRKKNQEEIKRRKDQLEQKNKELQSANKELAFQNYEKEVRTAQLKIANEELVFQNDEKEKRAVELSSANQDLTTFTYVSSHDLQEPLRKIRNFVAVILQNEESKLSDEGKNYLQRMYETAKGMQQLIEDLLTYSRTKGAEREFEKISLNVVVDEVLKQFEDVLQEKNAIIEIMPLGNAMIIPFQFRECLQNLISNSIKFIKPGTAPHITMTSEIVHGRTLKIEGLSPKVNYCHIIYTDNGIGFDPQYKDRIFEVFQRLHSKEEYNGTGMGLAICKRIIENHNGIITATGTLGKGARFDIYIPAA